MDDSVHVQVEIVELDVVWVRPACIDGNFDAIYDLNLYLASQKLNFEWILMQPTIKNNSFLAGQKI